MINYSEVPIRVYYHVTLMNEWARITEYIFDRMVSSGLYDLCEAINIGVLGDDADLPKFKELIAKYPKAQIRGHSIRKMDYEFHTLRFLKQDADALPKHFSVYLHSKGVSYPVNGNDQGKRPQDYTWDFWWAQFMTHYVVTEWKRWYRALNLKGWGYDIAGARIVPARLSASTRVHASGNFWAANSEYLKTISYKPLEYSEWVDIFEAEMYSFMGRKIIDSQGREFFQYPIVYILSNMFHDGFPWEEDFDTYMANFKNFDEYQI